MRERGDNIYYTDSHGMYQQMENDNHDADELIRDTNGKNVLIANQFYYFGRNCPVPDASWTSMNIRVPDRYIAYGSESDGEAVDKMLDFLHAQHHKPGLNGDPCIWHINKVN